MTKWTHSCVRLEQDGRVLVVDPGVWTEPGVLDGADAVLLTHEHPDHADLDLLARAGLPVVAPAGARLDPLPQAADVVRVTAGETLDVAGFAVRAVGGTHLPVLEGLEPTANLGYVVDDSLYHPGDALALPESGVDTLLVPMQGSWLLTRAAIEFVRRVGPRRAVGIHDGQINERAVGSIGWWLRQAAPCGFDWVPPGTTLDETPDER